MKSLKSSATAKSLAELHTQSPYPSIRTAWDCGLAELDPTPAQLEHGLELHSSVFTMDHFGFMPAIFTPELGEKWQALRAAGIGGKEFHFELSIIRSEAAFETPAAMEECLYALAASGLSGLIQTSAEGKTIQEDIKRLSMFRGIQQKARSHLTLAGSVAEIEEAHDSGRFFFIPSVNGPPVLGHLRDSREEFQWLSTWYNLGVRLMHLTYNRRNAIGDGCSEPANAGLSDLGRELVTRLNDIGIIVDVPHTGEQSCLDACATSTKPVMASHSGRKAFYDYMRNKSDRVLKAIADTDGLIGVVSLPSLLGGDGNLGTLLDAIEDMTSLVGCRHTAIATDYAYLKKDPSGDFVHGSLSDAEFKPGWWGNTLNKPSRPSSSEHFGGSLSWTNWPLFTVGLVKRGFKDDEIEQMLGGNFLRVLKANTVEPIFHPPTKQRLTSKGEK